MNLMQWLQAAGALCMIAALLPPRVAVLRPHARRIGLTALVLYALFAAIVIGWRTIAGPEPFMG